MMSGDGIFILAGRHALTSSVGALLGLKKPKATIRLKNFWRYSITSSLSCLSTNVPFFYFKTKLMHPSSRSFDWNRKPGSSVSFRSKSLFTQWLLSNWFCLWHWHCYEHIHLPSCWALHLSTEHRSAGTCLVYTLRDLSIFEKICSPFTYCPFWLAYHHYSHFCCFQLSHAKYLSQLEVEKQTKRNSVIPVEMCCPVFTKDVSDMIHMLLHTQVHVKSWILLLVFRVKGIVRHR